MPSCVFRRCTNYTATIREGENVSFHALPKDKLMKEKWVSIIRIQRREDDWMPTTYTTVCSKHFLANDVYTTKKHLRRLRKTAVPVIEENHSVDDSSPPHSEPRNKKKKLDESSSSFFLANYETDSDSEDEYYDWAKECALELRQMEREQQIFAKRAITYILMEGHLGLLNWKSVLVNNKNPVEETTQNDSYVSPLDEFLVIRERSAGTSSISMSHKTPAHSSRKKSKSSDKPEDSSSLVTTSPTTAASGGSSFLDNTGSSFTVASHKTAKPFDSSLRLAKEVPCENKGDLGSSSIEEYLGIAAPTDASSNIKLEPFDDVASSSHNIATSICSSPLHVKSEPCDHIGSTSLLVSPSRCEVNMSPSHSDVKSELNSPHSLPVYEAEYIPGYKDEPEEY